MPVSRGIEESVEEIVYMLNTDLISDIGKSCAQIKQVKGEIKWSGDYCGILNDTVTYWFDSPSPNTPSDTNICVGIDIKNADKLFIGMGKFMTSKEIEKNYAIQYSQIEYDTVNDRYYSIFFSSAYIFEIATDISGNITSDSECRVRY